MQKILGLGLVLFFVLIPQIFLGENSFIPIHDLLDYEIPWRFFLAESGKMFSMGAVIPQVMNGLPREFLGSGFNFPTILFLFLNPFVSYTVSQVFVHAIAFWGMYVLLEKYIPKENKTNAPFWSALFFALLPFNATYGLSCAGIPFLLNAILSIVNSSRQKRDWLTVALFPFFSIFIFSGIFILFLLSIAVLFTFWQKKHWQLYLKILMVFLVSTVIAEHQLIWTFLFSEIANHRSLWIPGQSEHWRHTTADWGKALEVTWGFFQNDQEHFPAFGYGIIELSLLFSVVSLVWKKLRMNFLLRVVRYITVLILIFSFSYTPQSWPFISDVMLKIKFLTTFNPRFYVLIPPLLYLNFGFILAFLWSQKNHWKFLGTLALLIHAYWFSWYIKSGNYFAYENIRLLMNQETKTEVTDNILTYKKFVSSDLFEKIKIDLGPEYASKKIASLGLFPAIAQLNGFSTLDSYQTMYPLAYHQQFRKIISPELEKSDLLKNYYDRWGNRCYLLSSQLGINFFISKNNEWARKGIEFYFDPAAFKEMDGEYVFSAVPIINADQINLKLFKSYTNSNSFYSVYVYQLAL